MKKLVMSLALFVMSSAPVYASKFEKDYCNMSVKIMVILAEFARQQNFNREQTALLIEMHATRLADIEDLPDAMMELEPRQLGLMFKTYACN